MEVGGHCSARFARVQDAFAKNFAVENEVGASFAATVNGELVVDLWGGHADAARTRPWQRDSLANVWSTTKAMTALCAHVLADRGGLDFDAPVARYWPEFAAAGKGAIPVRYLLSHQSGLAGLSEPMPAEGVLDWQGFCAALAAQKPLWEPGTRSGYHAITFGHLVGEVLRRIDGRTLGAFFRDEVASKLGAEFWIGLPESEEPRVVEMVPPDPPAPLAEPPKPGDSSYELRRALANPSVTQTIANTRAWRAAEVPAANGQANARGAARIMAALACGGSLDGVRLLREASIARAIAEQCYGKDLVLGPMRWGLGFMLASKDLPLSPNPRTFGHGGWGGSFALADCDARVSLAYVMNRMSPGTTGDKRLGRLIRALYGGLSSSP
ncbi:MAG TPA: serine hydrolase domain-containing protein [Myxococcota bacterium]|nr:serine hydrolase domain-containing protein [Myxococcota bacterium]